MRLENLTTESVRLVHVALEQLANEFQILEERVAQAQQTQPHLTAALQQLTAQSYASLQEQAALFCARYFPPFLELLTVARTRMRECADRVSILEKQLVGADQELHDAVQKYERAAAELDQLAQRFGFAVPLHKFAPVAENPHSYLCLTQPEEMFALQMSWEYRARIYNHAVRVAQTATDKHTRLCSQINIELNQMSSWLRTRDELPAPHIITLLAGSLGSANAVLALTPAQTTSTLAKLEQLLYRNQVLSPLVFADVLAAASPGVRKQFYAENHWYLANSVKVPPEVRARAAAQSLEYALAHPESAYSIMGFRDVEGGYTEFVHDVQTLAQQLQQSEADVSLLAFARHGTQLVAQLGVGDVAAASGLVYLVPGMLSRVSGIGNSLAAIKNLRSTAAAKGAKNTAYIVWQGYDTPNLLEETKMYRANSGGVSLATEINRIQQTKPGTKITLLAHSYGSTTSAQALKITDQSVSALVTVGSAGLAPDTQRKQLRAERVYATTAAPSPDSWGLDQPAEFLKQQPGSVLSRLKSASDATAEIGKTIGEHPLDPRWLENVTVLPANNFTKEGKIVGSHSLLNEDPDSGGDSGLGYLNLGTQSIEAIAQVIVEGESK